MLLIIVLIITSIYTECYKTVWKVCRGLNIIQMRNWKWWCATKHLQATIHVGALVSAHTYCSFIEEYSHNDNHFQFSCQSYNFKEIIQVHAHIQTDTYSNYTYPYTAKDFICIAYKHLKAVEQLLKAKQRQSCFCISRIFYPSHI